MLRQMAQTSGTAATTLDMKLDVESLRALRLVVDTGGFTEAAGLLGLTQSAVSWKIKRLEERVGVGLVKRGQVVEATPDGEDLLGYADRMLAAHDEAVKHLSRSELSGIVRIGSNEDLDTRNVSEILARFSRAYPNVRLDIRMQLSGVVCEWFDAGDVDLAVVQIIDGGPYGPTPDDIALWTEPLRWVHGRRATFDLAEPLPLITFGEGCAYGDDMIEALGRAGLRWHHAFASMSLAGVQSAVAEGLGVAALNDRNITAEMVVFEPGGRASALPDVSYVIRTARHGDQELLGALRSELRHALTERTRGIS